MTSSVAQRAEGTLSSQFSIDSNWDKILWDEKVNGFMEYLQAKGRSEQTMRTYAYAIRMKLMPWLFDVFEFSGGPEDVTVPILTQWVNAMEKEGLSPASRSTFRLGAQAFYKWLQESGAIDLSPFAGGKVPAPKIIEPTFDPPKKADVLRMLSVCSQFGKLEHRERALIAILFETALRAGELCSLRIEDMSMTGELKVFLVRRGKGGLPRSVTFSNKAAAYLVQWMRVRKTFVNKKLGDDGWVFLSRDGSQLTPHRLNEVVQKVGRAAGLLNLHTHLMRHAAVSTMLMNGMSEGSVRVNAGWARNSEMIYKYSKSIAQERAIAEQQKYSPLG